MAKLTIKAVIQGTPVDVYEHVTAFPAKGSPDLAALAQKYGRLESQRGETYTFHEDGDPGVTWEYTFNPPPSARDARHGCRVV